MNAFAIALLTLLGAAGLGPCFALQGTRSKFWGWRQNFTAPDRTVGIFAVPTANS